LSTVAALPELLAERVLALGSAPGPRPGGEFILYWMRTAVRGHENPALDVVRFLGAGLGLPVLVYHAVSERYPFASDRHHAFILEGARDMVADLDRSDVQVACHVERPGHRGPHLRTLAARSAVTVTEWMPVPPLSGWTERLADSVPEVPVLCVDTACVVSMGLVAEEPERAFRFRDRTARLRRDRVGRPWPDLGVQVPRAGALDLPFDPVDVRSADLAELIAACGIDHGTGPVADTVGGSTAGYERWQRFLGRIDRYARTRNDPLTDGTSRMSAYLHYGHVSPFRLAREACAHGGAGADKYLDELLVWRELAYAYCAHAHDRLGGLAALPAWARETLESAAGDGRPFLPAGEDLARGRTGDRLFDLAQRSLLRHGELHNNVRMTWGKALVGWSPDPETARARLVDLNHRFALDGRDPASYGGLYASLGLFDRPDSVTRPVFGSIRPRPTEEHARRLDLDAYAAHVERDTGACFRVAVVGAGIAGLACARTLVDHGHDVRVFDKGRAPGGRISSRRRDAFRCDHGAQFFTVRDRGFARAVDGWCERGVVAPWKGRFGVLSAGGVGPDPRPGDRYVGVPSMSSIARHLASDLTVHAGCRVTGVDPAGASSHLEVEGGGQFGPFDAVVVALPAPQAHALLAGVPAFAEPLGSVSFAPCLTAILAFDVESVGLPLDGAFVEDEVLDFVARDSSKPGRDPRRETLVLHGAPGWSASHVDDDPSVFGAAIVSALERVLGARLPDPVALDAHRWRFARVTRPLTDTALCDAERRLLVCGDFCGGGRVEDAFRSGVAAAGHVLRFALASR
jgi:predicted NAD/FAD-dependent oxidoreductase/deoxyribodipyrimidine photolyase